MSLRSTKTDSFLNLRSVFRLPKASRSQLVYSSIMLKGTLLSDVECSFLIRILKFEKGKN